MRIGSPTPKAAGQGRRTIVKRAALASAAIAALALAMLTNAAGSTGPGLFGRLVFATNGDGVSNRLEIAVINPDGSGFRALTHHEPTGHLLDWARDGRSILFVTRDEFTGRSALWRMDSHGRQFRRLPGEEWDTPSPSGRLVAEERAGGIAIVTAAGRRLRLLPVHLAGAEFFNGPPLWSPDGSYLAFDLANDDTDVVRTFVGRVDGASPLRNVTPKRHSEYPMSWSPDSRRLLIAVGGSRRVTVVDSIGRDGDGRRRVARINGSDAHAWSSDGRSIAFVGTTGGIFTVSSSGGRPRRVVATRRRGKDAYLVSVSWAKRGGQLAFSDEGGIFVVRPSGRGRHKVSAFGAHPVWSPAAPTIAFDGYDGSIYSVRSSGRALTRLTDSLQDDAPATSPDGSRVAFIRGSNGGALRVADRNSVWVMDASGRGLVQLGTGYDPHWSPEGQRVAYTRETGMLGRSAIMVAEADGSARRQVGTGVEPFWSADGKTIAYMRYEYRKEDHGIGGIVDVAYRSTLYLVGADGGGERALVTRSVDDGQQLLYRPSWSPDGASIALISSDDEGSSIILADPVTGQARPFAELAGATEVYQVAWSRDGTRLAFTGNDARYEPAIGVVNADGSGARMLLTGRLGKDSFPDVVWSPDGTTLGYVQCGELPSELQTCDVFTVGADGTRKKQLTRTVGLEGALQWAGSPPGR